MELSIIIVNYNGIKYLDDCLSSLNKYLNDINYEIIIIDNNSTDDSIQFIEKNYPEVILIQSEKNWGFGKGNNIAVKRAKGDFLLLINNDTILLSPLSPMLNILKTKKDIGVAGIKMLNANKEYVCSTGNFPKWYNLFQLKNLYFYVRNSTSNAVEVDWIEGSLMIIPKNIWDRVGGFSEDYFMYVEDIDLCKKIADLGYKRLFFPSASYIHFVGFNESKNNQLIKSLKLYCEKHMNSMAKYIAKFLLNINLSIKKIKNKA